MSSTTDDGDGYPSRTCTYCGEDVKKLPHHLRHECEVVRSE